MRLWIKYFIIRDPKMIIAALVGTITLFCIILYAVGLPK